MKTKSQRSKVSINGNFDNKPRDSVEMKRNKSILALFFVMRDKKFIPYVDDLFRLFSLGQIAEGLFKRYKLVPSEWREVLETLAESGDEHSNWFNENSERVIWLDETVTDFPQVHWVTQYPPREDKSDKVVDEMINNEKVYFDRLDFIGRTFAGELQAISQNKLGPEALDSLGLNINDIEFIFGSRLQKVIDVVEVMHLRLELLSLIGTQPIAVGGRVGAVADIFIDLAEEIQDAYGPYNSRYETARKLVDTKIRRAYSLQKPVTTLKQMKFLCFDEIWKETTQTKPILTNKTLDNILGSPIKHFTDYNVFLNALKKDSGKEGKDEETMKKLQDVCRIIGNILQEVDAYVSSQGEAEKKILKGLMKK